MPRAILNLSPTESEPQAPTPTQLIRLRADAILEDPRLKNARTGPLPPDEQKKIEALALSMREVGQVMPVKVRPFNGRYMLVAGGRRRQAALHINKTSDPGFELLCVVGDSDDPLRAAVHENLKRRGLSPLQVAYMNQAIREEKGWEGTRELSEYLQVSRASISQHDKLLSKPAGMDARTYKAMLEKVANGGMGAEAAFELLSHVEPAKANEVLEKAAGKAEAKARETARKAAVARSSRSRVGTTGKGRKTSPAAQDTREPAKQSTTTPIPTPTPVVTRQQVREAAREANAVMQPTHRSLPDFRRLFDQMKHTRYPDAMRSFVSLISEWWRGGATDKEVMAAWDQVSKLVRG